MKNILTLLLITVAFSCFAQEMFLGAQAGTLWTDATDVPSSAGYGGGFLLSRQSEDWYAQASGGYSYMWSLVEETTALAIFVGAGKTFDWLNIGVDIGTVHFEETAMSTGLNVHGVYNFSNEIRFVGGSKIGVLFRDATTGYGTVFFGVQLNVH